MLYRMIFLGAWAAHVPPKTQNQRELGVQAHKLQRLTEKDEFHFVLRIESTKRAKKLEQKNAKTVGLQYDKIVKLAAKCLQDIQRKSGGAPLSTSDLNQLMYGDGGLLTLAVKYGEHHAAK